MQASPASPSNCLAPGLGAATKPEPLRQPSITLKPPWEELPVEQTITAEESAPPVEETVEEQPPAPAPAPIKTALQGWLPQWDGPQTDRLAS